MKGGQQEYWCISWMLSMSVFVVNTHDKSKSKLSCLNNPHQVYWLLTGSYSDNSNWLDMVGLVQIHFCC